jgi:hypothetical protein
MALDRVPEAWCRSIGSRFRHALSKQTPREFDSEGWRLQCVGCQHAGELWRACIVRTPVFSQSAYNSLYVELIAVNDVYIVACLQRASQMFSAIAIMFIAGPLVVQIKSSQFASVLLMDQGGRRVGPVAS